MAFLEVSYSRPRQLKTRFWKHSSRSRLGRTSQHCGLWSFKSELHGQGCEQKWHTSEAMFVPGEVQKISVGNWNLCTPYATARPLTANLSMDHFSGMCLNFLLTKVICGVGKTAQQVKALAASTNNLQPIPAHSYGRRREPVPASCLLTSSCTLCHMWVWTQIK